MWGSHMLSNKRADTIIQGTKIIETDTKHFTLIAKLIEDDAHFIFHLWLLGVIRDFRETPNKMNPPNTISVF